MDANFVTEILKNTLPIYPINKPEDKERLREKLLEIVNLHLDRKMSVYALVPMLAEALDYCGSPYYQDVKDILLVAREKIYWDDKADDFNLHILSYCKNGWPQYEIFHKRLRKAEKYHEITFMGVMALYEKLK